MPQGKHSQWIDLPLALDWELMQPAHTASSIASYRASVQVSADSLVLQTQTIKQRLFNLLPYKTGESVRLQSRPGLVATSGFNKSATVTNPRGIFYSATLKILVEFWNTILYTWTAANTYASTSAMGAATDGPGGVCQGFDSAGNSYIFASTKTKSVSISSSGVHTVISDADFPTNVVPTPVYLDSYVFIPQFETRKIYNSGVGDQTSWQASTFIDAEEASGDVTALAIHHKHVTAFCRERIEFFQDAAIPSPNSPLMRVAERKILIGCPNRATLATNGDIIYFLGQTGRGGDIGIYKLEDFKVKKISNPSIDSMMILYGGVARNFGTSQSWSLSSGVDSSTFATGYMIEFHGKLRYCLVCNGGYAQANDQVPAWVYDDDLNLWIEIGNVTNSAPSTYVIGGWTYPYGTVVRTSDASTYAYLYLLQHVYGGTNGTEINGFSDASFNTEIALTTGGGASAGNGTNMLLQIDFPPNMLGMAGWKQVGGVVLDIHWPLGLATSSLGVVDLARLRSEFRVINRPLSNGNYSAVLNTGNKLNLKTVEYIPSNEEQQQVFIRSFGIYKTPTTTLMYAPNTTAGPLHIYGVKIRVTPHEEL